MTLHSRLREGVHSIGTFAVYGLWSAVLLGAGYAAMAAAGHLSAIGAALLGGTVTYAVERRIDPSDRLTDALFASGYLLATLSGAAATVSLDAMIPFLIALAAWLVVLVKRLDDIEESDGLSEKTDAVESEVSV